MGRSLFLGALPAFALLGCLLDPIDYEGKSCPCPAPDWACDPATNRCVAAGTSGGSASSGSGGCDARIVPSNFRVGWATPNTLRWTWDASGSVDQFGSYRLVVGKTRKSVETETGAITFTAKENPELGKFNLVHTGAVDPVVATISDGLEPATEYFAKLVAVDNGGCAFATEVLSATTSVTRTGELPLFVDEIQQGGYTLPESIEVQPGPDGSASLVFTSNCTDDPDCYENLRLYVTVSGPDVESKLSPGDFENLAYLEMKVAIEGTEASYWSQFRLQTGELFVLDAQTVRAGGAYRTYQIPLRALVLFDVGARLMYEDVAGGVVAFGIGGFWAPGKRVWIDDVAIRW